MLSWARAGREWSPEAYLNMDIRTTVNNVAHQAQFSRMDDYGVDLIEVSSHAGARPRCAPFQGMVYSRSGGNGFVEDLNGKRVYYSSWKETSFGEAAGLLGINCGHQIYPFFPGLSTQTYEPTKDLDANDRAYGQSQQQRYLERQVRNSKRECAMLDAMGDREGFDEAAQRLKQRQQSFRDFAAGAGRTIRLDRSQVSGYNRSVAAKVTAAAKRAAAESTVTNAIGAKIKVVSKSKPTGAPNSITQVISGKGGITRNYYGADRRQTKQISNNDHGHKKERGFGQHGEHAHDYVWQDGKPHHLSARELTADERKENSDIL